MEHNYFNILGLLILSALVPKWLLLLLFTPLFMVAAASEILSPLFSIGDADIQIYDLILFICLIRVAAPILIRKQPLRLYPEYLSIAIFLCVLLVTTIVSYYRFGEEVFISEIISFIRLLTQIMVLFLISNSIRTTKELLLAWKIFDYIGYAIAITVYLSLIFFGFGMIFGEVQSSEGINRYFGFIGDQVGFIILLFIFKKLIDRDWIGVIFFTGALLATGTRGALLALLVGQFIIILQMRNELAFSKKRIAILVVVLVAFVGIMALYDFGGMRSRFTGYQLEAGWTHRLITFKLAAYMFIDNIITGVGYTGFRHFALDYGAWEMFAGKLYYSDNFIATAGNQYLQVATDAGFLGLITFAFMSIVLLRTLKKAAKTAVKETKNHLFAGYVWLLSLLLGNLTAAWLLPGSLIAFFLWIILGFALLNKKKLAITNYSSIVLGFSMKKGQSLR